MTVERFLQRQASSLPWLYLADCTMLGERRHRTWQMVLFIEPSHQKFWQNYRAGNYWNLNLTLKAGMVTDKRENKLNSICLAVDRDFRMRVERVWPIPGASWRYLSSFLYLQEERCISTVGRRGYGTTIHYLHMSFENISVNSNLGITAGTQFTFR